jgi:hypothetical protein
MVKIKVAHYSAVLVDSSTSEDLIEGTVDLGKGHRTRSHKTFAIFCSFGTELR